MVDFFGVATPDPKVLAAHLGCPLHVLWKRQVEILNPSIVRIKEAWFWTLEKSMMFLVFCCFDVRVVLNHIGVISYCC